MYQISKIGDDAFMFLKEHIRIDNLFEMIIYLTGGLR